MRTVVTILLSVVFLFGCSKENTGISDAMALRERMTKGDGYGFRAAVTADYGDRVYDFVMDCIASPDGTVEFTVVEPETISDIKGTVSQAGGKILFDDEVLLFEPLTGGQVTPVIGPYLMVKAIQGGYIRCSSDSADIKEITIDDTLKSDEIQIILSLQKDRTPVGCEIFWNNRRILSILVTNFEPV